MQQEDKREDVVIAEYGVQITIKPDGFTTIVSKGKTSAIDSNGDIFTVKKGSDNQNKLQQGDQMEDGSYYAGVDEMGEDFFFWLESINYNQKPPVTTFKEGAEILRKKHQDGEVFHGHKFSSCQLDGTGDEDEIKKAIKDGTFDHGIHRPRKDQGILIKQTLALKPELRAKALQVFAQDAWFQTASPYDDNSAWLQHLHGGTQYDSYRYNLDASLLVGRSAPQRKLG